MKNLNLIGVIAVIAGCSAQAELRKDVPITVQVIDEIGFPVENAGVGVGFRQNRDALGGKNITGSADTNGMFFAKSWTYDEVGISAKKDGFYPDHARFIFTWDSKKQLNPFDPAKHPITLILKHIKNPIPMYVKQVRLELPEYGKPLGFDFGKGDWVAPYGSGVNTDMIAYAECDNPKDLFNHNFRMTVSFPNEKDGIVADGVSDPVGGCELKSDHMAPENGYEPKWIQIRRRTMYKILEDNSDSNRKYYFRVRTKLDKQGNIISAQYGKIYGDFFVFTYYLNPTPNDRNVEFDPDKNLFGGRDRFAP